MTSTYNQDTKITNYSPSSSPKVHKISIMEESVDIMYVSSNETSDDDSSSFQQKSVQGCQELELKQNNDLPKINNLQENTVDIMYCQSDTDTDDSDSETIIDMDTNVDMKQEMIINPITMVSDHDLMQEQLQAQETEIIETQKLKQKCILNENTNDICIDKNIHKWQWKGNGHWNDFEQGFCDIFEDTYLSYYDTNANINNKRLIVSLPTDRGEYEFNLESMQQKNCFTGKCREIRRVAGNISEISVVQWQYEVHEGWTDYGIEINKAIEIAFQKMEDDPMTQVMPLEIHKHSYVIDFKGKRQINVNSNRVRSIQRLSLMMQ